jgi:dynactin 4
MNNGDSAFVLYVDHEGHPAPLSLSYHATASRRLASSVNRHPPSTITEVDSAYCPQCLSFHDATTAANLGYCPKPTCRLCPLCRSVASISVDDSDCFYKCGRCQWNSMSCFLKTSITISEDEEGVSSEEFEKASNELGLQWKTLTEQRNHAAEDHYRNMLTTLTGLAKDQVKGLRSSSTTTFNRYFPTITTKRGLDGLEAWSVKALEESIKERGQRYASANQQPIGGQQPQLVSLALEQPLDESLQGISVESILLQENGGALVESRVALLPLAVPLRPRKSRRCRAELAEGRPGILLKPKLNPLEGDSSLRTGHGQWWKKVRQTGCIQFNA